jgi:hypothetical protein
LKNFIDDIDALFPDKSTWCQFHHHKSTGEMCLVGAALYNGTEDEFREVYWQMYQKGLVRYHSPVVFNDTYSTTFEDIKALLTKMSRYVNEGA